ncbi:MAG: NAD(P)H-hydrate dehydratase [Clostridia bacterium]|nr:NAD(P)H-hydrate dehydratase [Clostridia bacterium]
MKIVTPGQMKAMDLRTVEEGLFSSLRLMQNAAEALYREISAWIETHGCDRVLLLAGPGNNGGDAYALACLLEPAYHPAILPVGGEERSPDCTYYFDKCKKLNIPFVKDPAGYPLVVDGVFGTGFHGALPQEVQELFEKITVPVAAIDLPSGMDGSSGVTSPGTLKPELTVTFAFQKPCHLLADCGNVVLADIGIPSYYADGISRCTLAPELPERFAWGHKNSYGAVGLRVGAPEYPGAAALAIKGALCSGAGLVFAYLPEEARRAAAAKFYGPVLRAESDLLPLSCHAYLVGSGLGRSEAAAADVQTLWESELPLVVDGDGLWNLGSILSPRNASTVLTPHMGEFSRLCGLPMEQILQNRIEIAEDFASKNHIVLVLKDAATVVTDGSHTEILSKPCSALAKGGSGDLLAGLIAGLLAGGAKPFSAAKTGVWLHNRAGHLAAKEHSVRALQPEQIAEYINNAWMELEHGAF